MSKSWQEDYGLTSLDPLPHNLPELQAERTYLFNSLNAEIHKATDLLRRIPPLEHSLLGDGTSSQKRKTRKHLGWLKHRFQEASRQERTILQRLGQLTWEIQHRERMELLEEARRLLDQEVWHGRMSLNPTVPEFHPQVELQQHVWQAPGVNWQQIPWNPQYPPADEETLNEWSPMDSPHDVQRQSVVLPLNVSCVEESPERQERDGPETMGRRSRLSRRSSSVGHSLESSMTKVKRNSLPNLAFLLGVEDFWKRGREAETCAEQKMERRDSGYGEYLGFYVKE